MGKYGEWYADRCRERKEPVQDDVMASCQKCKAEQPDLDGFGVLQCQACGYCTHPAATDGKCDLCGADQP